MSNVYLSAAQRLHDFMHKEFWTGTGLVGPDCGVRFNRRVWRFGKSVLRAFPWNDTHYYYLQGQGYWVMGNWELFEATGDQRYETEAIQCAHGILQSQQPEGYWIYPHPGWRGRIGTVEGMFAALGMLETYRHTGQEDLLAGSLKWYNYLFSNVGFMEAGGGLAVNYFANVPTGPVPNNSTLALAFLGQLAEVTGDDHYLKNCPEMITFLDWCQLPTGEFPYQMKDANGAGRDRVHFQCFQYHAFQLQDLAMYHDATGDDRVLPLIANVARFLAPCVNPDGSTQFSCTDYTTRVNYNTAAIAAALGIARRKGAGNYLEVENRAYSYVLANQQPNGGFAYSNREYQVLSDRRFYPRTLSMVLYHLMLKARETQQTASSRSESTPQAQPMAQTQPTPDIAAPGVQTTPTS